MSNSEQKLSNLMRKKGFKNIEVKKEHGHWNAVAFNPLKKSSVSFASIGSNFEQARQFLFKVEDVPHHYLCAYSHTCTDCGVLDKPIGYTNQNGDFIHKCNSCGSEWIAITAAEEEEAAMARMEEAQEIINPELRSFMQGRKI